MNKLQNMLQTVVNDYSIKKKLLIRDFFPHKKMVSFWV